MSEVPLLEIDRLTLGFPSPGGALNHPVDGISLQVRAGERLGIVGESGSGKSLTALACLGLVPEPGRVIDGSVAFEGRHLLGFPESAAGRIRGSRIGLVLQEATDALNPVYPVGFQLTETIAAHSTGGGSTHRQAAIDLLERVAIDEPQTVFRAYPHELSGGLAQRAMMALALAGQPKMLIADEPTSSLDPVTRQKILALLDRLCSEEALALVLISHDLTVVEEITDRVLVMYEGQIIEEAPRDALFSHRLHPYTRLLFESIPGATAGKPPENPVETRDRASAIGPGCRFSRRCPMVEDRCRSTRPDLIEIGNGHRLRCPVMAVQTRGSDGAR